ncbi:hypothetical protein DS891_20105 [Pseudoalteromonas sp. JC28]|nr:hypothetical protein [Pseudoalteromonas sp. JC28]
MFKHMLTFSICHIKKVQVHLHLIPKLVKGQKDYRVQLITFYFSQYKKHPNSINITVCIAKMGYVCWSQAPTHTNKEPASPKSINLKV